MNLNSNLWIIFRFSLNVRNLRSRHSLDNVWQNQTVGQLRLEVLDPAAASKLVQIMVRPVGVDLDDRLRLRLRLARLRGHHRHQRRRARLPRRQATEGILSRIHFFLFLFYFFFFFVYFDSVTSLRLNEHNALEKNKIKDR